MKFDLEGPEIQVTVTVVTGRLIEKNRFDQLNCPNYWCISLMLSQESMSERFE